METTLGTLLGGRVRYEQPAQGFRSGIEPVLLAASVPAAPGQRVVEGGTGAGAVLICLAARVPGVCATGIERDPSIAAVARRNVAAWPGLSVHTGAVEDGLDAPPFDHACANPPWHDPAGTASPDPARHAAKTAAPDLLLGWCAALVRLVRPGGSVTLVLPASHEGVARVALRRSGAGGCATLPLLPKEGRAPKIALVQARKGERSADRTLPGLLLHRPGGQFTAACEAVLRDGEPLAWGPARS